MRIKEWLRNQTAAIAFAVSSVEKNVFNQKGEKITEGTTTTSEKGVGTLSHALKNSQVNQEVKNLRWRMYKVLSTTEETDAVIIGFDESHQPIMGKKDTLTKRLKKVKVDDFDTYETEMLVDNTLIYLNVKDAVSGVEGDENKVEVNGNNYYATNKGEYPISIYRETIPKFELETYTTKLIIRTISETEKLLEFYVSKYPNPDNRRSYLFISDIKKAIDNPRQSSILDIKRVSFVSNNTLGAPSFHEYEYEITGFDKIIEFNGSYVIKFKSNVLINGKFIFDEFKEDELDKKYKNKVKRKR